MTLENQEWDLIQRLVVEQLLAPSTESALTVLKPYFPEAVNWPLGSVAQRNAETVVRAARQMPLSADDPASIRLVQLLISRTRADCLAEAAHLEKYLDRLVREKAAIDGRDPLTDLILPSSGQIFINRTSTRRLLAAMVEPEPNQPEPLALRVTGEERAGKSYTYSLISHVSAHLGFAVVRVPLHESSTAEEVVFEIATHLGVDRELPEAMTDSPKQSRQWAVWLAARAVQYQPQRAWWFVFDQCNELDEGAGAVELIAQLATAISETNVERVYRPRLVLLGHCQALADLQLPTKQVYVDQVGVVSETEVRDFFSRVFRETESPKRPTTQEDLDKVVEEAVHQVFQLAEQQALANRTPFMQELDRAVQGAVDVYAC